MADNKYSKEYIRNMLIESQSWLERGILAIYRGQTSDEVAFKNSRHRNKRGFNAADAKYLSNIAEMILSDTDLSQGQVKESRRRMLKYSGQLADIVNEG